MDRDGQLERRSWVVEEGGGGLGRKLEVRRAGGRGDEGGAEMELAGEVGGPGAGAVAGRDGGEEGR